MLKSDLEANGYILGENARIIRISELQPSSNAEPARKSHRSHSNICASKLNVSIVQDNSISNSLYSDAQRPVPKITTYRKPIRQTSKFNKEHVIVVPTVQSNDVTIFDQRNALFRLGKFANHVQLPCSVTSLKTPESLPFFPQSRIPSTQSLHEHFIQQNFDDFRLHPFIKSANR